MSIDHILMDERINESFLEENVWPFCQGKKSGDKNNEVILLPRWS